MCAYKLNVGARPGEVGYDYYLPSAPTTNLACTISVLLSSSIASKRSTVTCIDHCFQSERRVAWSAPTFAGYDERLDSSSASSKISIATGCLGRSTSTPWCLIESIKNDLYCSLVERNLGARSRINTRRSSSMTKTTPGTDSARFSRGYRGHILCTSGHTLKTLENYYKAEDRSYLDSSIAARVVECLEPITHCQTRKPYNEANVHSQTCGAGFPLGSSARRAHSSITDSMWDERRSKERQQPQPTCNTSIVLDWIPSACPVTTFSGLKPISHS